MGMNDIFLQVQCFISINKNDSVDFSTSSLDLHKALNKDSKKESFLT